MRRASLLFIPTAATGVLEYWLVHERQHVSTGTLWLLVLGAVGLYLVLLDFLIRVADRGWYRKILPHWCVVPFVLALFGVSLQHYHEWQRALNDIREVARDLQGAMGVTVVNGKPQPELTIEQVDEKIAADVKTRFGDDDKKESSEKRHFTELARVVGHDLHLPENQWNPDEVRSAAERDTLSGFLLALSVQALFVLWIPLLLAVAIARARRRLEDDRRAASKSLRESLAARDQRILGEDNYFFIPRLCFAAFLVLGTNYVFSPFGMKASYVMSLVDEHALPGHASWTLWSTSFSDAPVIVVGFVGFLFYALITATQRFMLDDLDDQAVFSLLVRGLVVVLLSLALSASPLNDSVSRTFVFVAGVFPARALAAMAKQANVALDPDFPSDAPSSFDGLPSLDPTKVFALRTAGIQSTYDLAAMRIADIAERVRIDPRLLGRTVDRAILIDAIGPAMAEKLDPYGITSATELVAQRNALPEKLLDEVGNGPKLVAERLACDARVEMVRNWLDLAARERPVSAAKQRLEVGAAIEQRLHALAELSELDADDPGRRRQALRGALQKTLGELDQTTFLSIDISAFGSPQPAVKLVYAAYDCFDELTDDVFYSIKVLGKLDAYQYGRQWELRRVASDPTTVIPHARVTQQRGWGFAVDDPTPLAQLGIHPGDTLYAVPLRLEAAARSPHASPP